MSNIDEIVRLLKEANQKKSDFVHLMDNFNDAYLVLIACILSLRTNDKTTYPATLRMLKLAKTPEEMMKVSEEELSKAIYPVGFYANKAKQIIQLSKELVEKYNGKVPCDIDELCKFNGVGRKTANLVVSRGFNKPAICVDVHVHRIFNRLGYVKIMVCADVCRVAFAVVKRFAKSIASDKKILGIDVCLVCAF